jgi:hypothetical protein
MNREPTLAEFGTFDVENYGDLLYPIIFAKMFQQRGETREIRKFSFMESESLQDSGYTTRPIQQLLLSWQKQPHSLVIGGGDLLRTDWDLVASHYPSTGLSQKGQPLPFHLRRLFLKRRKRRLNAASKFRHLYMNYPAVGPFMIDPGEFSNLTSVAYCSCGVPFPFDDTVRRQVASTFDKSNFLYVRDRQSQNALVQAGVKRKIHVAPDLIVALSDLFDPATERIKGRSILEKKGVDMHRPVLCVQSNPQPPENSAELLKQLKAYQKRTRCEVVLLPLARCHGDNEYLKQLAQDSNGAFKCIELDSIFEIIATLGACNVFLGTSLHGNITAFSFGIPHLFGPIPVAKCEGFLDVVNLPPELKLKSWAEINQKLDMVTALDGEYFTARATAAKQQVNEVFDLLVQAVATA